MKIESSSYAPTALQTSVQRAATTDASGPVGAVQKVGAVSSPSSDVNLSSLSALHTSSDSDIDVAKVESIKAALREGTYHIDSSGLADGMLNNARDLLQTRTFPTDD